MAVETGVVPESELDLAPSAPADAPPTPPSVVAGIEAVDAEPNPDAVDVDEQDDEKIPTITVRDRKFTLRTAVPGMLLMRLAKGQLEVMKAIDDPEKQAQVMAATGDSIVKLVVPAERGHFTDWLEEVDPPIEVKELMELVKDMMEKVSGRPTQSA